jgi:hypothetical protein
VVAGALSNVVLRGLRMPNAAHPDEGLTPASYSGPEMSTWFDSLVAQECSSGSQSVASFWAALTNNSPAQDEGTLT